MKKILFGILTLIGVGLSFCNAENINYELNFSNPVTVYDSGFNIIVSNSSFYRNFNGSRFSVKNGSSIYPMFVRFTGFTNSLYLNNICFYTTDSSYSSYGFFFNGSNIGTLTLSGENLYCYNFSTPIDLSLTSYSFNYYWRRLNTSLTVVSILGYKTDYYNLTSYRNSNNQINYHNLYFPFGDNKYLIYDYSELNNVSSLANDVVPSFYSISFSEPVLNPKFKVNYGNTSYEYELEDNLSIYLKSPVTQNGNTFTYDGSTGLNLFYNGSSQFYGKPELYINTPSWLNNNIFTPICL